MCRRIQGTDYNDFSLLSETDTVEGQEAAKKDQNFPVRLHYMLAEMEKDGLQHIVSWQPHGRCFIVHDQQEFVKSVLPMWFRQTKFPSFQRQLNIYGFTRIAAGPDKGAYYHELFLRGKQFLAQRIDRVKGGQRKQHGSRSEPNFYRMPPLPPSDHVISERHQKQASAQSSSQAPSASFVASAPAGPNSISSLHLPFSARQNPLLQPEPLFGGASPSSSSLVDALLARRQLEQARLLRSDLSAFSTDPASDSSSSLLYSLLRKQTENEPNSAPTHASSLSESSSSIPAGLEALCAATDSTLAIRALEAATQQRLQQQQSTQLLLWRLLDADNSRQHSSSPM